MKTGPTEKPAQDDRGIRCPACGCGHWRVVYTRVRACHRVVRGRMCRHCGRRITTVEQRIGSR